jgi:hypothetical protein
LRQRFAKDDMHTYEVCLRNDKRGVDLISDALPFGRLISCDQISMTAPCPSCNGVVTVPIQSTSPPRPLPLPKPQNPRKTAAWGLGLQVIGMLLCWTVVGDAIVGIPWPVG